MKEALKKKMYEMKQSPSVDNPMEDGGVEDKNDMSGPAPELKAKEGLMDKMGSEDESSELPVEGEEQGEQDALVQKIMEIIADSGHPGKGKLGLHGMAADKAKLDLSKLK